MVIPPILRTIISTRDVLSLYPNGLDRGELVLKRVQNLDEGSV